MQVNSNRINIAVTTREENFNQAAKALAHSLNVDFVSKEDVNLSYDYFLLLTSHYLGIETAHSKNGPPFYIDFLSSQMNYRMRKISLKKELLARAIGVHPKENVDIVDATAGWGRDSFILASLGFKVIMIERSFVVHALLSDGLKRAQLSPSLTATLSRITLLKGDSQFILPTLQPPPHIIYLDMMFPERKKTAAVKKEMILLQDIVGKEENEDHLMQLALACASKRLVVKRPKLGAYLGGKNPHFSLKGTRCRFDVYLLGK